MTAFDFIKLCDSIQPLALDCRKHEISDKIYDCISALTNSDAACIPLMSIRGIKKELVYLSVLDSTKDYNHYYDILDEVTNHTGWCEKQMLGWDSEEWKVLIATIKYSLITFSRTDDFMKEEMCHHELERARAAKRLKRYGVSVKVVSNELEFANQDKAFSKLDELAETLGGESIIQSLIRNISVNSLHGRLMIPYQGNQHLPSMVKPEIPWGLIFNISQKHFKDTNNGKAGQKEYEEFIQLAIDISLAIYDVQKFSFFEDILHRGKDVIRQIRTLVTRHVLYTFPQCSPEFAINWCLQVAEDAKKHERSTKQLCDDIDLFINIQRLICANSRQNQFTRITESELAKGLGSTIPSMIKKRLVIKAEKLNADFITPDDYHAVNGWKYPMVAIGDDLLIYPLSISAWNWYEALLLLIKDYSEVIVGDIGYSIENFIKRNMREHNIIFHSGKYAFNAIEGECDILVQCKEGDMLFECKKKPLTTKAKSGSDISALIDLSDSLIESQYQCARTMYGVRTDGSLTLQDEGCEYQYNWVPTYRGCEDGSSCVTKKRHIENITLTLNPFGFMEDEAITTMLLEDMMNKSFHVDFACFEQQYSEKEKAHIENAFDDLNSRLVEIAKYHNAMGDDHPFFFCRFFDLEKLYYFITQSNDNESFYEKASKTYMTVGTQEFWYENSIVSRMLGSGDN